MHSVQKNGRICGVSVHLYSNISEVNQIKFGFQNSLNNKKFIICVKIAQIH